MALIVPIQSVPSQTLQVVLNGQATQIYIFQKTYGVFIDISLNNSLIIAGVLCENDHLIIRNTYLGYAGDFLFDDTQGTTDPDFAGLGTRYLLYYLTPADLASLKLPAGVG